MKKSNQIKNYKGMQESPFNKGAFTQRVTGGSLKTNKGITLIALIITIIIMLILVGVTITVAVNGGLFEYAGRAGRETQNAIEKEQTLANGKIEIDGKIYNSIDEYINGVVPNPEEKFSKIYEKTETYSDETGTAVIPKGFAVGTSEGINKVGNGLVITDEVNGRGNSIGNEFVWVPVTYTVSEESQKDANGLYPEFLAVFYRSNWVADNANGGKRGTTKYTATSGSSYNEPYASGYSDGNGTEESKEYYEMMLSVQENKGFYIGRYEAGSTTTRTLYESDGTTYRSNGTTEMVVKRDAYPYNYVGWGLTMSDYIADVTDKNGKNQGKGALLLSKELYGKAEDEGKYGVTSTLCYGIQWDAMLDFVKDSNHNVTSSKKWGNYKDNRWTITRKTARYTTSPYKDTTWNLIDDEEEDKKVKTSSSSILLTTGASDSFAAKNIFDVAGNVEEWTCEANSSTLRVLRGGIYNLGASDCPPSLRPATGLGVSAPSLGFRPALYITNE